jgi:Asp-tRNA(Asn)/Glu-tRNA(Gln) amidotransferase A subunit family amidase
VAQTLVSAAPRLVSALPDVVVRASNRVRSSPDERTSPARSNPGGPDAARLREAGATRNSKRLAARRARCSTVRIRVLPGANSSGRPWYPRVGSRCFPRNQPATENYRTFLSALFGAKDIIETRGLSTEYGSPIYKGRIGTVDAAIVQDLRRRGAILLGKTHTAAFAHRDPAPTRNPRNPEHTPGGSSSGSAAAVAAGMVPFALGTQTLGSVLRPASYCGVTGFKASYGLFSLEGVLPNAKSLDTLGFFTHTPGDMLLLWQSLGHPAGRDEEFVLGAPERALEVEPEMRVAFQNALTLLRQAGVSVREIPISAMVSKLHSAAQTVQSYEGARFHEQRFKEYGDRLGQVATLVREGMRIPVARYQEARQYISGCRARMAEIYKATPVILVPAATGPPPLGLPIPATPA